MAKLTNEQLEVLVNKRNKLGVSIVEVMTNEELASYRINCTNAIAREQGRIERTTSKVLQGIAQETITILEDYIKYIDEKLTPKKEVKMELVKVNTGSAIHLATESETALVGNILTIKCGSLGRNLFREKLYKTNKEVKAENITCKKCLKLFLEMNK